MSNASKNITAGRLGKLDLVKKLGEGGQGSVYLVRAQGKDYALKWYHQTWAANDQKRALQALVHNGPPESNAAAGKRFVWPIEIAERADGFFGYVMDLIDTKTYLQLGAIRSNPSIQPSLAALAEMSFQLVDSFRALHLKGYAYRDISDGNVLVDPRTGNIKICDNDNVGVNGASANILGTFEYMAPEIIRDKNVRPSANTDLHSLATLLFKFWTWHHPFHGELEAKAQLLNDEFKSRLYGSPVFIFDPNNQSNRPPLEYDTVLQRWQRVCPEFLRERFINAFTVGLNTPSRRVNEGDWRTTFLAVLDCLHQCKDKNCGAELIMDTDEAAGAVCWHCKQKTPLPPRLVVQSGHIAQRMLLKPTFKLKRRHVDPSEAALSGKDETIGEMVQNPNDPKMWGLKNLTTKPWNVRSASGTASEVPPGKSVGIVKGIEIFIENARATIKT